MSSNTLAELPLAHEAPAQRLRRLAAAVRVQFTWWGVHRTLTAQQKEEVGSSYAADSRFLTAGKKLIDIRHEAYRQLTSLRSRITHYWRGLTLPYVEAGVRLLRQSDVEGFVQAMEGFRTDLTTAEQELHACYEQLKADARHRLGRLFQPGDYPPALQGLFTLSWDFPNVEVPAYLQRLDPALYQQEQERVARRFEQAVELAEQAFLDEFSRLLTHLTERLGGTADGQPRIFRDSVVGNLTTFFERFRQLNVRSNAQLDELVERAQQIVRPLAPQELRDNRSLRQQVATQLSGVQAALDGLMVERPRRQLLRPLRPDTTEA